jgi:hypothetical protein
MMVPYDQYIQAKFKTKKKEIKQKPNKNNTKLVLKLPHLSKPS